MHDIERVVENNANSLLKSNYAKKLKAKKLLVISDIINQTQEDINVEFVSRKLVRLVCQSNKFTLTNAIAWSGANAERMIEKTRNLTHNP